MSEEFKMMRWLIRRDMNKVVEIETLSFNNTYNYEAILKVLRENNVIGLVLQDFTNKPDDLGHGQTLGYLFYSLESNQYLPIINMAVHPDYRRQGLGTKMVSKMFNKLSIHRRTRLIISPREPTMGQHLFWTCVGFQVTSLKEKGYQMQRAFTPKHELTDSNDDIKLINRLPPAQQWDYLLDKGCVQ